MNYKDYIKKNKIDTSKEDVVYELSNLITEARLHAGISQAELAKRIGTHQPSIARAESGEVVPSVEFLYKIAKAISAELILPRFSFMNESRATAMHYLGNNISGDVVPSPVSYFISESSSSSRLSIHTIS